MTTETKTPKELALEYLDAVARKDLGAVRALLAPDLRFRGPAMARSTADDYVMALRRLGAIHLRNEVRRVFEDGDEVCVIASFGQGLVVGDVPIEFAGTPFTMTTVVLPASMRCGHGVIGADLLRHCTIVWGSSHLWAACRTPAERR